MQVADSPTQQTGTTRVSGTRRWLGALLLGAILPALAAVVAAVGIVASSRPAARIARDPIELHPEGDFTHPAGFVMPEKAGPFERELVIQYDQLGRNLSAGYNGVVGKDTPLPVVVTLYVYPASSTQHLDGHFDQVVRDLGRSHGGARPEFRRDILLGPRRFVGRYAAFGYEEPWGGLTEDIPLRSYLVLYRWNGWWVKWRVTTPAPVSPERMRAIVELTESVLPPEAKPETEPQPEPSQTPDSDPDAKRLALSVEEAARVARATEGQ